MSHVVPDLVQKVLKGQDPLHILGDGRQVRHYTYGGDLARGIRLAIESPAALNEDFNLSTDRSTTVLELSELIWQQDQGRRAVAVRLGQALHLRRAEARPLGREGAPAAWVQGHDVARQRRSTRSSRGSESRSRLGVFDAEAPGEPETGAGPAVRGRFLDGRAGPKARLWRTSSVRSSSRVTYRPMGLVARHRCRLLRLHQQHFVPASDRCRPQPRHRAVRRAEASRCHQLPLERTTEAVDARRRSIWRSPATSLSIFAVPTRC